MLLIATPTTFMPTLRFLLSLDRSPRLGVPLRLPNTLALLPLLPLSRLLPALDRSRVGLPLGIPNIRALVPGRCSLPLLIVLLRYGVMRLVTVMLLSKLILLLRMPGIPIP